MFDIIRYTLHTVTILIGYSLMKSNNAGVCNHFFVHCVANEVLIMQVRYNRVRYILKGYALYLEGEDEGVLQFNGVVKYIFLFV